MRKFVLIMPGIALLSAVAISQSEAIPLLPPVPLIFRGDCQGQSEQELKNKLGMLQRERERHLTNIQRMKEELSRADREQRVPDVKRLRNTLATAGGQRGQAYQQRPEYIRGLVDEFESGTNLQNWWDAVELGVNMARRGVPRAHYEMEIKRSQNFISLLDSEKEMIFGCLGWYEARHTGDQPTCPTNWRAGRYLIACDPGMGGEPPFISDAGQQRFGGGIPQDAPTSGATGGGQPIGQPGLKPPPEGVTAGQQPPQQAIWCYSEKTKEYYMIPYGPCPPPWVRPPIGTTTAGEPGRTPWKGLVPPEGKPPMGPASCGPATSCTCAGGGIGHIPCDKSKGACHCGAG